MVCGQTLRQVVAQLELELLRPCQFAKYLRPERRSETGAPPDELQEPAELQEVEGGGEGRGRHPLGQCGRMVR